MDTSNSRQKFSDFRVRDLDPKDDKELIAECRQLVQELIGKLKPILKYVCSPIGTSEHGVVRAVALGEAPTYTLFLEEKGQFLTVKPCGTRAMCLLKPADHSHYILTTGADAWEDTCFATLLEGMESALAQACEMQKKRADSTEARLAAIRRARQALTDNG